MIDLILSEIKHLWYSKKYLPKLKRLEYLVTQELYYSFLSSAEIKDNLFLNKKFIQEDGDNLIFSDGILKQPEEQISIACIDEKIKSLKNTFCSLPLKTKIKQLNEIKFYEDLCTTFEDYMITSSQHKVVAENYILLFYAEVILQELKKEKQNEFINLISKKIRPSYPGNLISINHEEKILLKWNLDLNMQSNQATTKLNKI